MSAHFSVQKMSETFSLSFRDDQVEIMLQWAFVRLTLKRSHVKHWRERKLDFELGHLSSYTSCISERLGDNENVIEPCLLLIYSSVNARVKWILLIESFIFLPFIIFIIDSIIHDNINKGKHYSPGICLNILYSLTYLITKTISWNTCFYYPKRILKHRDSKWLFQGLWTDPGQFRHAYLLGFSW